MSRAIRSGLTAFVILVVVALFWPTPISDLGADSYGRTGPGQRALFELLDEIGVPVRRSLQRAEGLDPNATLWWIQPWAWCGSPDEDAAAGKSDEDFGDIDEPDTLEIVEAPGPPEAWLQAGGTAVVFLPSWLPAVDRPWDTGEDKRLAPPCEELAGRTLPPRALAAAEPESDSTSSEESGSDEEQQALFSRWWRGELDRSPIVADYEPQEVTFSAGGSPRALPIRPLLNFDQDATAAKDETFRVLARLDGEPFILEAEVGAGRLVVVADSGFLLNRWLDLGDAAPLAVDLVRRFGAPVIDERTHGYSDAPSLSAYLLGSAAVPVFVGLVGLGLLIWAHGSALPARRVTEFDPAAPALEPFVDSLAELYGRSKDFGALGVRYRDLSFARIRRHMNLAPDFPKARIIERLKRDPRRSLTRLRWLEAGTVEAVVNEADLRAATSELDALVEEVCR